MTEHEMRVAIGELVEPHPVIEWNAVSPDGTATCFSAGSKREIEDWLKELPGNSWAKLYHAAPWKLYRNYPADLNAMLCAEDTLSEEEQYRFCEELAGMATKNGHKFLFRLAHAKAIERAEAFLRVKCKWKD